MNRTYSIILLSGKLTRGLEEISEFAFIILADILDGVDVERNQEAVDRRIMVWTL